MDVAGIVLFGVGVFPNIVAYVELRQRTVVAVMLGAFIVTVLGFTVREFGQLIVGSDLALRVGAPLFGLDLVLAVLAFCLIVLIKQTVVSTN